ncbi:hypothetical protein NDU88_001093 [Pleurodeles waltl]|uniref:Uncharacterized protein n=1 Tax=Pleurodeles waltl TaxID=8319 RepID=A0AAV7TJ56_PLEWA|nr:hypothetical protein NDU88_001093 [Pleurodeles waltl]
MLLLGVRPVRSVGVTSRAIAGVSALQGSYTVLSDRPMHTAQMMLVGARGGPSPSRPPCQAQRVSKLSPDGGQGGPRLILAASPVQLLQGHTDLSGRVSSRLPGTTHHARPPEPARGPLGSPSRARSGRSTTRSSPNRGKRPQCCGPHSRAPRHHQSEGAPAGDQGDRNKSPAPSTAQRAVLTGKARGPRQRPQCPLLFFGSSTDTASTGSRILQCVLQDHTDPAGGISSRLPGAAPARPPAPARRSLRSPSRARPGQSAVRSSPLRGERPRRRGLRSQVTRQHRSEGVPAGAQGDRANPALLLPPSARYDQVRPAAPGKGRDAASSSLAPLRAPPPPDRGSSNVCSGGRRDLCTRLSQFGMRQGTGS